MPEQITLYTGKICPGGQRVEIALIEAGAEFTRHEIDLQNKPSWFTEQVNPVGKIPALSYGGPKVPPDHPHPESVKLAESLVLLEFVADLFPGSKLLPRDPVLRARARFFIDAVNTKFVAGWMAFVAHGESADTFFSAVEAIQALLTDDKKFAVSDDLTIADAAIAPFLARVFLSTKNDLGNFAPGEGRKVFEVLNSPRFSKLTNYYKRIEARESFKSTFDEDYNKGYYDRMFNKTKAP
ncbi:uncharacterized protein FOMMEDRAFT_165926 [Fomitiporia mediterranea MF3/22]|uniref:uncharacterized protein n=1 Tax=Fomitiporia mediterranea (strain MF3/22) TaxID=694068 RepID=UPI00044081DF|nr:uncharacterized protein FOMMEDRAFT_165926 [Fomitiporia mediterranea MF3/22]EJD05528.1 hypothetical protein FOMMEDRAFT_165926 [Fomitiporia mediterranea MF3/22]